MTNIVKILIILRYRYVEAIENVSLQPQEVDIIRNSKCQTVAYRNVGNNTRIMNTGMYNYMGALGKRGPLFTDLYQSGWYVLQKLNTTFLTLLLKM